MEEREEKEKFGYLILATKTIKLAGVIEFILKVNWRMKNKCFFSWFGLLR